MYCLARISDIVKRGRGTLKNGHMDAVSKLRNEAEDLYDGLSRITRELRTQYRMTVWQQSPDSEMSDYVFVTRLNAH